MSEEYRLGPHPSYSYGNAPIIEAILEATILRATPVQFDELTTLKINTARYPDRVEMETLCSQTNVGEIVDASAQSQKIGYQYKSADGKFIIQSKSDGFSVSRLAPYTNWQDLCEEFTTFWICYAQRVAPDLISKLAVRYVNRFDLPGDSLDLSNYFRTYPELSKDIKYPVTNFLHQIQLPMPDINGGAVITQARLPSIRESVISVLLDIAVYQKFELPLTAASLRLKLDGLRDRKNELFEACIKSPARELIRETNG